MKKGLDNKSPRHKYPIKSCQGTPSRPFQVQYLIGGTRPWSAYKLNSLLFRDNTLKLGILKTNGYGYAIQRKATLSGGEILLSLIICINNFKQASQQQGNKVQGKINFKAGFMELLYLEYSLGL